MVREGNYEQLDDRAVMFKVLSPDNTEVKKPSCGIKEYSHYCPTPADVMVVKAILNKAVKVPIDIIDTILDHAEYWARSCNFMHNEEAMILSARGEQDLILRCLPVGMTDMPEKWTNERRGQYTKFLGPPRKLNKSYEQEDMRKALQLPYAVPSLKNPVRKITFSFRSQDQGWGGSPQHRGTFFGSWTWFEAGLEKLDAKPICDLDCEHEDEEESDVLPFGKDIKQCAMRTIHPEMEEVEAPLDSDDSDDSDFDSDEPDIDSDLESEVALQLENRKFGVTNRHGAAEGSGLVLAYKFPLAGNPKYQIQRNRIAEGSWAEYFVTWSWKDDIKPDSEASKALEASGRGRASGDGSLVRSLELGDVITVWGLARFQGWSTNIEKLRVDIYWAV